jgi:outer membrane protein assembly factor BamB
MKMLQIISLLFLIFAGCRKPVIEPIPPVNPCAIIPCDTSKLEIIWEKPIMPDTQELHSMNPVLTDNEILFSQFSFSLTDTIKFYDKVTGIQNKIWADYIPGRIKAMTTSKPFKVNDNILFTTWDDVYAINYTSGNSVWRSQLPSGSGDPFINVINDKIYHIHHDRRNATNYVSYLVSANVSTGIWDTVHTQAKINNYQPFHGRPALWVNADGDSILVFQLTFMDIDKGADGYKTDIVALNLRTKQEYFRFEDADIGHGGSRKFPYLVGDKMFVPLGANMVCIDMPSKTIKWRRQFDAGFTSGQPFIYVENKFFVKPDNRSLYQLDMETGNILWQDLDNGSGASDMVYYDGILYYTCSGNGKIYAVEVSTGKKLWAEPSPNKYKNKFNGNKQYSNANIGFGGIAIDSSLGYLYTSDFYFHICLKLPKK